MSFLDNLESNLKSLESQDERDPNKARVAQQRRESDRARSRAAQPWAEQLRKGPFTSELLAEATRLGHGLRTKVYISWMESTLRLDAREHRLELRPTADGIVAEYFHHGQSKGSETVDLEGNPKALAARWMKMVGPRVETPAAESDVA